MRLKSVSELKNLNTERIRRAIQEKRIFTKSMIFRGNITQYGDLAAQYDQ